MRFVTRSDQVPDGFEVRARKEYDNVVDHNADQTKTKSFEFKTYKRPEIKHLLQEMFHGKCAYCETFYAATQPMDVEHYRPKGAVSDHADHDGYWWLAMKWDNLLPSCIDCNRKRKQVIPVGDVRQLQLLQAGTGNFAQSKVKSVGKKDSFPLTETGVRIAVPGPAAQDSLTDVSSPNLLQEEPLLLNPCNDTPEAHLNHHFTKLPPNTDGRTPAPVSFMVAATLEDNGPDVFRGADDLSLKGAASIYIYGLNRLDLVQARTELLRRLEFLKSIIIQLHALADDIDVVLGGGTEADDVSALLKRSTQTARGLADEIAGEIAVMARKEAPYSSMVQAWRRQLEAELTT